MLLLLQQFWRNITPTNPLTGATHSRIIITFIPIITSEVTLIYTSGPICPWPYLPHPALIITTVFIGLTLKSFTGESSRHSTNYVVTFATTESIFIAILPSQQISLPPPFTHSVKVPLVLFIGFVDAQPIVGIAFVDGGYPFVASMVIRVFRASQLGQ